MDNWQTIVTIAVLAAAAYAIAVWIGLVVWTWRDASHRAADNAERIFAAGLVAVFGLGGWIIYLLMRPQSTLEDRHFERLQHELLTREMTPATCGRCRRRVSDDFMVCPYCREELRMPCASCERPVQPSWVACAWCGADVAARAPRITWPAAPAPATSAPLPTPQVPARPAPSAFGR